MMERKSFLSLPIFKEPACLITTSEDGKLQVETEPMKQIQQIDAKLVVVAIAGLYRTGKSYLLNLLAGSTSGFPLGNTFESKTKGIWVWCRKHPKKENTVLLLLDTEGLGDVAKGDSSHDNKIFTIAALLSNVLVYNMKSAFDQDAIEKLTFITEMSKNIRFSNAKDDVNDEELGLILPTFVLCIRDFTLMLEKDGQEITPDKYLDDGLQLKCGNEESIAKYNRPRECIRKYFLKRKCFVFDRPGGRETLKELETIPFEKLESSFNEETDLFLNYMYTCEPKVLVSSKPVNGGMFVTLVDSYLNAIRNGAVPDVDDAIMAVANIENEKMANKAVEIFQEKIEGIQLPILHTSNFEELNRDLQKAALKRFRNESMFNAEQFEKQAMSEMDELWDKIKTDNLELVRQHCECLFQELYMKHIGEKMKRGEYKVAGGYPIYKLDMDAMKRDYMDNAKGIDEYEVQQVLINFLHTEAENDSSIMFEDKIMTEENRQREIENLHTIHKNAQTTQQKLYENKLQEEKHRAEKHQREMDEERKEYMKYQNERMAALVKEWEAQRQLNVQQMQLMRTQNESQRKVLEEQVNKLITEHQKIETDIKEMFANMICKAKNDSQQKYDKVKEKYKCMIEEERTKTKVQQQKTEEGISEINALKKESQDKDAKNAQDIKRLENERNEYKKRASQSSCHIM